MFRAKTTRRNAKRAPSPIRPSTEMPSLTEKEPATETKPDSVALEKKMVNFFEAESAAVSISKPWLRLERGIRLQKYRAFADSFPSLTATERTDLYTTLLKANDTKLLNTKQTVQYENGVIQSIKGLKVLRPSDSTKPTVFKIDISRPTKKNTDESHLSA